MSVSAILPRVASLTLRTCTAGCSIATSNYFQVRSFNISRIFQPEPGKRCLRFRAHFPEDGQYTVKPLKATKLGGRDPETGRIIHGKLGGGAKRNYRWIDFLRKGPTDGTFFEERVLNILYDPNRTGRIALVASGDKLRYIVATHNMQKGDLIKTSSYIPRIPVRPKDGDAYPLGALPIATTVCCVELIPGEGAKIVKAAGTTAIVKGKLGNNVVIQLPSKRELALAKHCMATVGRVSNIGHGNEHIGSAQRNRWLGNRPSSGLWQRKDGYAGRKIRPLPPVKVYEKKKPSSPTLVLHMNGHGPPRKIIPATNRVS